MKRSYMGFKASLVLVCALACTQALAGEARGPTVERVDRDAVVIRWPVGEPVDILMSTHPEVPESHSTLVASADREGTRLVKISAATRTYFRVRGRTTLNNEIVAERSLPLEAGVNFRDLGGYRTSDGRTTKWGQLYRSGTLAHLTPADYQYLDRLSIAVVSDLRSTDERRKDPTVWRGTDAPKFLEDDYQLDVSALMAALTSRQLTVSEAVQFIANFYREAPFRYLKGYRMMFSELLAGHTPLAVHCSAGKDRTGVAAALILHALGVDRETVIADFLLSNQYYRPSATNPERSPTAKSVLSQVAPEVAQALMRVDRSMIESAFAEIERRYGSIDEYLVRELSIDSRARARLRELYSDAGLPR